MRMSLSVLLAVVLIGAGATLAAATGGGGWHYGGGSAHVQYKKKQVCKVFAKTQRTRVHGSSRSFNNGCLRRR